MKDFNDENISKSRKKGFYGSEPAPSIEEEADCMKNICECLYDCLSNIRRFLNQASKDLSMESIDQALECFQLAVTLLSSDPEPERLKALVFDNALEKEEEYTFISLLLDFVSVPQFTKSNAYIESSKEGGYQLQIAIETDQLLNHLKIYALKCMSKFVSICSYESRNMYEQTVDDQKLKALSKMCAEAIADEHGIDVLMEFLFEKDREEGIPNSGNEEVRLAVAECLFFFVVRNEVGRLALLLQKGVSQLLKCLESDSNALVRSYCCAILREFSNHYPDELLKENTLQVCIKVLNIDSSQEVRALSAEIIEIIFKSDPKATQFVSVPTLCKVLNDRLTKDSSRDVLEAVCKLLETLFSSKIAENSDGRKELFLDVHREFISKGYWKSFIRVLKQCTVRPASLAVRALRYLLQTSPYEEKVSRLIVGHFQTLSVLLKSSLEQNKTNSKQKQNSTMIAHKLLKVELSIVLAILFLQSPHSRKQVNTELTAFPLWMSTLRGALLKHLSYAEPEYFSDIRAVDEKGINIYSEFKALGKGLLNTSTLKDIFSSQEVEAEGSDIYSDLHSEFMDDDDKIKGKINHFILSFAIHETLSENPVTSSPVKEMESPTKEAQNEPPYLSSDSEMTPRPKNSPEKTNQLLGDAEDSFINQFGDVMAKEQEVIEVESADSKSDSIRESIESPQKEIKGRPVENYSPIMIDSPMKNHSTNSSVVGSIASARSIVSRSSISISIQKRQFENTVYLCKKLGQWYESKDMRVKKQKAQDSFVKAHRLAANTTGSRIIPTGYVSTPDGLVLRYKPNESPQKLSKSWSDEDIKTTDVFTFEIPFDDFTVERVERIVNSLGKHIKYIKKSLVICPKSPNAKGRRTFLMDLNINILPKTQMIIEELLIMMKEYGVENIKMPIYLWKGKERKDTTLTQYNVLEILEFVKIHLANYFQGELERLDSIRFNNSIADSMTKQEM
ncbi:hypothetical protein NAEGRDRAFT_61099 [Naegleria gruberi]|uniref:Uncharacterized protein n=1 Tax=Naegleria gruberi TaxID=5762 RepID=D2UXF0_NAEGR|nr:uncharacterized protein NAEGRDRAFT_61099 [Naegleria gruberi]EFC50621.1 hypothetical protein NAEGRDRAFT_61099 [Naegleria gruberi]|eukprot:XP_002683365.1 hypothetical protein NAEGRDRAFT_61099 [Naegleria gruberi strain NEG-M]